MRERKFIKFRTDMYEDTKFKIIDMKPERDVIHYIWSRIVVLAGKVNLEGNLFLSKNIPYTIETLAIEFNREPEQVKLALDIFMELEMVELIDDKIFRVKNFAKHQNIKVKEKEQEKPKENVVNNIEVNINSKESEVKENLISNICIENKESNNSNIQTPMAKNQRENIEIHETNVSKNGEIRDFNISHNNLIKNIVNSEDIKNKYIDEVSLNIKNNKKQSNKRSNKEKLDNITDEEIKEDTPFISINEGERILEPGERILQQWVL